MNHMKQKIISSILAIIIIMYVAEFIAGYINQDTIAIYQELINQK